MEPHRPALVVRLAAVFGAATLIWLFIHALLGTDYGRGRHVVAAVLATTLAVPMVVLAFRRLDRLPWSRLRRAPPRTVARLLLIGVAAYLVPAALAVALFTATDRLRLSLAGPAGDTVLSVLALAALVFFYEALPEEFVFRGYLYRNLATALPVWAAVLVQAGLFALFGVLTGSADSAGRAAIFLGFGVAQGVLRAVTDTIWVPIGFHLAFQTAVQLVGPDWGTVLADDPAWLRQIALGLIPITAGVLVIQLLGRRVTGRPATAERS